MNKKSFFPFLLGMECNIWVMPDACQNGAYHLSKWQNVD